MREVEIPAQRGRIYDRYGELVLGNKRMYDLVYIPQYVLNKEKTLKMLSYLVHVSYEALEKKNKVISRSSKVQTYNT